MRNYLTAPRLIYVMRDPVQRLVSQYVHQWTENEIRCDLDSAVDRYPELIAYSSYAQQLTPFIDTFGREAILPIFFDRLLTDPDGELKRVCKFIGYERSVEWKQEVSHRNVSAERVRRFPLFDVLIDNPVAEKLRRGLVPKSLRTRVRQLVSITEPPKLSAAVKQRLEETFDKELGVLGSWLGTTLDCRNFRSVTASTALDWH
jgi:hypothetical protein